MGEDATIPPDARRKPNFTLIWIALCPRTPRYKGSFSHECGDLTPRIVESLKASASMRGVSFVDVFDMERLRHALDSPRVVS